MLTGPLPARMLAPRPQGRVHVVSCECPVIVFRPSLYSDSHLSSYKLVQVMPAYTLIRMDNPAFHPVVQDWFDSTFAAPTEVQRESWPRIARGEHLLITAPTDSGDRRRMLRHPPEILITTPESLNLLLSSKGGQSLLGSIDTVILDEIHGVISSKRGVYLMSAVERLVGLSGEFQRIALSATVNPLETVAEVVGGYTRNNDSYSPRQVGIIHTRGEKIYDISVRYPEAAVSRSVDDNVWDALVPDFVERISRNKSTLLFVNSRALCEKITH